MEIARHIPPLAAKRGLDSSLMFAALGVMPVDWKASSEYEDHRARGRSWRPSADQIVAHRTGRATRLSEHGLCRRIALALCVKGGCTRPSESTVAWASVWECPSG